MVTGCCATAQHPSPGHMHPIGNPPKGKSSHSSSQRGKLLLTLSRLGGTLPALMGKVTGGPRRSGSAPKDKPYLCHVAACDRMRVLRCMRAGGGGLWAE